MGARKQREPALERSRSIAAVVALLFLAGGAAWLLITDLLIYALVADPVRIGHLEMAKGWAFVFVATAVLYVVTDRAVRSLARSEATTRAVVESIDDGVLLIGPEWKILSANPAAVRMLGVGDAATLMGMGAEEFTRRFRIRRMNGQLVQPGETVTQRALEGDRPPPYKALFARDDHTDLVAICTSAPVRSTPEGAPALAVSVLHDVTLLDRLDRLRDQFVAAAAHILKTPVAVIRMHSHLVETSTDRMTQRTSIAAIERQCGRIARLTDNLLVIAALRSNTLELHPEVVDWAELVEDAVREMLPEMATRVLVGEVAAHPLIYGDRERLLLVVRNLIEMAFQRSRPDSRVVLRVDERPEVARVDVAYDPLPPEELVFEEEETAYTGVRLEQHVVSYVVEATRGTQGSEEDERGRRHDWVEVPIV
ncbi:MAG: histidine kinase dimerization/phospho-acceptor domain-containing protein [Kofleriaceae bacterium]|nr:histidine kinase dimerization/phospho-acceptor domain-containing protein [Kofleriaceae bacterium]